MESAKKPAKSNITLKLDTDLLRELRILAAKRDTSISALLSDYIRQVLVNDDDYQAAKERALARMRDARPLYFNKPKSRDELHER
jgi:predicted transcriptional regulator